MTDLVTLIATAAFTATVTGYAPQSGDGISGGAVMANGKAPYLGAAACPVALPFGSRVRVTGRARTRLRALRLPVEFVCADRFREPNRAGIDVCIPLGHDGLTNAERIELARLIGAMRSVRVEVVHE